jgi:hypothetical protein
VPFSRHFSVLPLVILVSSPLCSCVVSLWRLLPFIRKFNRRVTQSSPTTAATIPPSQSIPKQDLFFSNATLRHALLQILLLLRDIAIGFPALLLTVASLVRLPSFIANIASACLSRQVSMSKPTALLRTFTLCVSPTTDFIRLIPCLKRCFALSYPATTAANLTPSPELESVALRRVELRRFAACHWISSAATSSIASK